MSDLAIILEEIHTYEAMIGAITSIAKSKLDMQVLRQIRTLLSNVLDQLPLEFLED